MTAVDAQELLRRHLAGEDVTGEVTRLVGSDPTLAPVLEMLSRRSEAGGDDPLVEKTEQGPDLAAAELLQQREILERVRHQIESLGSDLAHLRATLEDVAAALGACPVCVGADRGCRLCHGRGGPGWIPPHPGAFAEYVVPAVRAHQYSRGRGSRSPAGPPTTRSQERKHHAD